MSYDDDTLDNLDDFDVTPVKRKKHAHGNFMIPFTKDGECVHNFWIKRCSVCRAIMESDAQHNLNVGDTLKVSYTDLDTLVCTYKLSMELKELKLSQKSKLFWVIASGEEAIITLRTVTNVKKLKREQVFAAYTSSELLKHLYRAFGKNELSSGFGKYITENAHDPNRLARLLISKLS